jgi:uncharacterized protein YciI
MAIYAVQYIYSGEPDELAAIRPQHRAFTKDLFESGVLLASGPLVNRAAALLLLRADSWTDVVQILDNDPFEVAGLIGERDIEEWNPIYGPWEAK